LALAALALVVFGAYDSYPTSLIKKTHNARFARNCPRTEKTRQKAVK